MTEIFVFGSNLAGRHGAGSALEAKRNHGAKQGVGRGPTGNAYAIPTKDRELNVYPLGTIQAFVNEFLHYAWMNEKTLTFNVVAIGCGLAGYKPEQIAPMFRNAPPNVKLPKEFLACL